MLEKVEEFNMDKVIQEFELLTRDARKSSEGNTQEDFGG